MLTPRMRCVADFVPHGMSVADIGCDHAYVAIDLCQNNACRRVIAMDVRKGPLEIADANVRRAGLETMIELRLSDGLDRLRTGEVDAVVIAGMGGLLIRDILLRGQDVVDSLSYMVLQPQSEIEEVRRYVRDHAFEIMNEAMIWDKGKPYFAMQCVRLKDQPAVSWEPVWYRYGKHLLMCQDAGLLEYLRKEQHTLNCLQDSLQTAGGADSDRIQERLKQLQEQIQMNAQALAYYREV